jgi:hypothetical protein
VSRHESWSRAFSRRGARAKPSASVPPSASSTLPTRSSEPSRTPPALAPLGESFVGADPLTPATPALAPFAGEGDRRRRSGEGFPPIFEQPIFRAAEQILRADGPNPNQPNPVPLAGGNFRLALSTVYCLLSTAYCPLSTVDCELLDNQPHRDPFHDSVRHGQRKKGRVPARQLREMRPECAHRGANPIPFQNPSPQPLSPGRGWPAGPGAVPYNAAVCARLLRLAVPVQAQTRSPGVALRCLRWVE